MSNGGRRKGRRVGRGVGGRTTPRSIPKGQPGFSVDRVGETIMASFDDSMSSFSITWNLPSARAVGEMILRAVNEGEAVVEQKEMVLGSGLVVPPKGLRTP